jgi:AcrR family transcriptional regulator
MRVASSFQAVVRQKAKRAPKTAARRKEPVQERSQRRLEAIVDAAAASFADFGFDATTMEGIAARAGTSIGSVYQFFPNKMAVFHEVARRALETVGAAFVALLGPAPMQRSWSELLDATIDGFRRLSRTSNLIRAMNRNMQLYNEYSEQDQKQLRGFQTQIAALLAVWAPDLPPKKRTVVAAMLVNTVATTMLVIALDPTADAEAIVDETKLMLRRYLAEYVTPPARG